MKIKCQYCGCEYYPFESTAIVKAAFCCLAHEMAWKKSRIGYPNH